MSVYFVLGAAAVSMLSAGISSSQLTAAEAAPTFGLRTPALSPDGKRLAFVYRGDIWVVSAEGGRATAITSHIEYDAHPVFSPDGKSIAFGSKRNGNWDIYIMPAEGGVPRQITWHSGNEYPTGWSPDCKSVVFSSKRDSVNYQLFEVDVNTLQTSRLLEDFAAMNTPSYSPDGATVLFSRYGFPNWRPRYSGSAAAEIWLFNKKDNLRSQLTQDQHQHLWPRFLPDGKHVLTVTIGEATPNSSALKDTPTKFVDSALRTPNLWLIDLRGKREQLTHFVGGSVRSPSVASKSGDIAFEYEGWIHLMKSGKGKPTKLEIIAESDEKQITRKYEKITTGAGEGEPSSDGKYVAFSLRGDIWCTLTEKPKGLAGRNAEFARRLTDWAGDDSDFIWSKDNKKLYFVSDREFNSRLYSLDVESLKIEPLWKGGEDVANPGLSPDGKKLGFWVAGPNGGLHVMDLATKESKLVVKLPGPHMHGIGGISFSWSPDNQWIAYVTRSASRANNIFIVKAAGGEPVNVTRLNAHHSQPAWSPDGKYLFFQSQRNGDGLYVLPLKEEQSLASEVEIKFEKPKTNVTIEIDFNDITQRIRKFANQPPQADLTVTADGLVTFISEGDIWTVSYDGKETKRLTTGGGKAQLRILPDGKKGFFIQNGELQQIKVSEGKVDKITFTADWERDVKAERQASFAQFWRIYNRAFYDGNFHGRNWETIRKRYEPFLSSVDTDEEFAIVLQWMVGELEASHSEVTAESVNSVTTPHLGFAFDYSYQGPGVKVASVPQGSPAFFKQTEIKTGELVLEINGAPVTLDETLYQKINHKNGREFEFLVNGKAEKSGARKVKYKVMTSEEWTELDYKNRINRLRKYVESKSENKIGYVHISAMGGNNQTLFEQEIYEYIAGKQAMIIDVRFNRGGNISDTLVDWLERRQHGWAKARDAEADPAPTRAWEKPVIVLINEHSYSNGEMFPFAMKQRGIARLLGVQTPGYVIWTYGFKLLDGTNARLPMSGVYRLDGSNQENNGEKPDILVGLSPEDWLSQKDPQLDKAIELLIKQGSSN